MRMSNTKVRAVFELGDREKILKVLRAHIKYDALVMTGFGLETLPEALADLDGEFATLNLSDNLFKQWPQVLGQLSALRELNLSNNAIKALPEALSGLSALESLDLRGNKLRKFPDGLFSLPALTQVQGVPKFSRNPKRGSLERLLRHTRHLPAEVRRSLFKLTLGQGKLDEVPHSHVLAGVIKNLPEMMDKVQAELKRRSLEQKLDGASECVVVGAVDFKKTELKEHIKASGARYSAKPTAKTTHVVCGSRAVAHEVLDGRALTFLSAPEMSQLIVRGAGELAADDHSAKHAENISRLLLSHDVASQDLGMALIGKGGMPQGAETGLFVVARLDGDTKRRAKARKLLKKYGSLDVLKVLSDRSKLDVIGDKAERRTAETLHAFARQCHTIDWCQVARAVHRRTRYGLSYILTAAPVAERVALLREHLKDDGALDYRNMFTPSYAPDYENNYSYYSARPMPDFIFEVDGIKALDLSWCCFGGLSPDVAKLESLHTLDLSGNMLTKLPDEIIKLTSLRTLKVNLNALSEFPAQIAHMPWLTRVELQGNRAGGDSHLYNALEVPEAVSQSMPDCTFVVGLSSQQQQRHKWNK